MESVKQSQDEKGSAQERSTIAFPYTDLDNGVELAKGVHNAGGTACDSDQLAAELKMEAKGGGFRMRITGAQTYGLATYERGGRVTLTDLGRQIIDAQTERTARMNAFLNVPLFQKVFEDYKGSPLPPQAALERALVNFGVGAKVADRARQVMLRSAKQAGFFEAAADRLVKPSIRQTPATVETAVAPDKTGNGNGSGGGGGRDDLHPLINGLLMTLPKAGNEWGVVDRFNWLTMANSIFKNIYKRGADAENQDVDVSLKGDPTKAT